MKGCTTLSNGNNQCARPHALKPHKKMKTGVDQAAPPFTFPFQATTCVCRSCIGNFVVMSVVIMGGRGMIFFFPTATQSQTCPVLMPAVAFAARRIELFYQQGLMKKTEQDIVVGKTVFGSWRRTACRHQVQIATSACALVMTTGKGGMFSNTLFSNCAVQNINQNLHAHFI